MRGPVTAEHRKLVGEARDAVVRMPREKAAAAGRAGVAAARTSATSAARREARLGGAGDVGCGCEGLRRGDAAAVVLRRRGGLAGGAAGEWMALIGITTCYFARRAWGDSGWGLRFLCAWASKLYGYGASPAVQIHTNHPVLPRRLRILCDTSSSSMDGCRDRSFRGSAFTTAAPTATPNRSTPRNPWKMQAGHSPLRRSTSPVQLVEACKGRMIGTTYVVYGYVHLVPCA